jgi:hypothetical protein
MITAVLIAMVPSMVLLMLHLAIGPFGHVRFLHWHLRWKTMPVWLQRILLLLATGILLAGASHLLGIWQQTPPLPDR